MCAAAITALDLVLNSSAARFSRLRANCALFFAGLAPLRDRVDVSGAEHSPVVHLRLKNCKKLYEKIDQKNSDKNVVEKIAEKNVDKGELEMSSKTAPLQWALATEKRLRARGLLCVVARGAADERWAPAESLKMCVTAEMQPAQIERALAIIAECVAEGGAKSRAGDDERGSKQDYVWFHFLNLCCFREIFVLNFSCMLLMSF